MLSRKTVVPTGVPLLPQFIIVLYFTPRRKIQWILSMECNAVEIMNEHDIQLNE